METGTLKELNVQPGDVVEFVMGKSWWTVGRHYVVGGTGHLRDDCGDVWKEAPCCTFRIVSRATPAVDLTAITTPFGLLDKTTQDALRAHGGPYEAWMTNGTWAGCAPAWAVTVVYRVKPVPKRETVTRDMWADAETGLTYRDERPGTTPIRITVEKVDGKADWSTHRVEAR